MAGKKQRGRGEGSIYRRKDSRHVGQYDAGGKRRYVYGKSRAEVSKRLNAAIAERDKGIMFASENIALAAYLDMWLDSIRGTVREHLGSPRDKPQGTHKTCSLLQTRYAAQATGTVPLSA